MALPIDAHLTPLTKEQVEATILNLLTGLGVSVTSWKRKGTARNIIGASSTVIAGLTLLLSAAIKGTILELAEGIWLTLLAFYVYGVTRVPASFAEGVVTLENEGGGVFELDPGDLVVLNKATGKSYVNTARVELGALETLEEVPVRAVEIGSASTATPGQIDAFVTPLLDVTVTNPAALVGVDEQLDPELREDCADARSALSPLGAKDAYSYFAKRIIGGTPLVRADGTPVGVNRTKVVVPGANGAVTVYVATASGAVAGDIETPGTDLYLVHENIKLRAAPWGTTVTTANATPVNWTVKYTVHADASAGKSAEAIESTIDAALVAYFATYPIGGLSINGTDYYVFVNRTRGIIDQADSAIVSAVVNTPTVDAALTPGQRVNLIIDATSSVTLVAGSS